MSDLISRQAGINAMEEAKKQYFDRRVIIGKMQDIVNNLPSAEPERKKGKWIDTGDFEQCSVCTATRLKEVQTVYGKALWIKTNFCPNCGADMRGEKE